MKKVLDQFSSIVESPYPRLAEWKKETGKKIIGCLPMYVPEELIHAAGMLPVVILGKDENILLADRHNHPYLCHSARSNFDLGLQGKLDFLDVVVFTDFCYTVDTISDGWRFNKPDGLYHHLFMPKNMSGPHTKKYLQKRFLGLKSALEEFAGQVISNDSLRESISVYNHNRRLLHRLYQFRRANPGFFRARDVAMVVAAGLLMPKEEHNQLLSELLERAEAAPRSSSDKARLVVSGYLCDMPEMDVLNVVEEAGAIISDDDLYVGRRYFSTLANEGIDPMEALVQRYMEDVPCPTKYVSENDWDDYILNLVKGAKAEAVVMIAMKWCHPQNTQLPGLSSRLSEKGVPNLTIETDYTGATGQIRTRLEAFIEMLRG